MKKVPLGVTIGLMAVTAGAAFLITTRYTVDRVNDKLSALNEKQQLYSILSEADNFARASYLKDIDEEALVKSLINGYAQGLGDKGAMYLTADEYKEYSAVPEGMVEGLGFDFEKDKNGYIKVRSVEAGGAAEEAGITEGDMIAAVNNTDVIAFEGGYDEAVSLLSCTAGTRVSLYVKRTDEYGTNFIDYDVVAKLSEHITVTHTLAEDVGFIRIKEITAKTEKQLSEAIANSVAEGAEKLVFDVRDLSFNDTETLRLCLDHIIGAEDTVFTVDKDGNREVMISCTEAEQIKMPMAVLINERTEGCAELFAAALKDLAGAKLVGTPTAGSGTYRKPFVCSDGSVLLISTAYVCTPETGIFDGKGLIPDTEVIFPSDLDMSKMPDIDAQFYDTQFIKAMEVLENN
ncbi:MAG: PDZ domain-containing protein [Oscillospiraceae bacterium]|nr:PDZ domain-containing protein [Oscillospiraceae bacterium]